MNPKDRDKSIKPSLDQNEVERENRLSLDEHPSDPSYYEHYTPDQRKKARIQQRKIEAAQRKLEAEQERIRQKNRRYPLPESARDLAVEQISRTSPLYFLLRWEFYVALAAFAMAMTYFPWAWVAEWGVTKILVVTMEQLVVSIDKLPSDARNLPVDESKAQLSIIHLVGAVTLAYRLSTQRPTIYREVETWRFFIGFLGLGVNGIFFMAFTLFWPGYFPDGLGYRWHESLLQVSCFYSALWLAQFVTLSWAWSYLQKLLSRVKRV